MPTFKGQKYQPIKDDGRRKKLSAMFRTAEELEAMEKTENILAACPEEIVINEKSKKHLLNPGSHARTKEKINKAADPRKNGKVFFTEEERIKAATTYALVGNASRVEEITGIPSATIRKWKTMEWWPQIIDRIRNECDDELDVKLTGVIDKAVGAINDRLEHGEWIYDSKEGELRRKPVASRDAAYITASFVDKRTLIRKKVTQRGEQATINERLSKLAQEFEKFTKAKDITPEAVVVEEVIDNAVKRESEASTDKAVSSGEKEVVVVNS